MKKHLLSGCLAAFILLPAILTGAAGAEPAGKEGRSHPWRSPPPDVIFDGTYGPPWPCPYPRPPACSPGYPYGYYPPCYQPDTPWYQRKLPDSAGWIAVLVMPVHAKVYVDGHALKRGGDLVYEAGLLSGQYKIEARADGYTPHEQTVQIRSGQRMRLTIRLRRPEPAAE